MVDPAKLDQMLSNLSAYLGVLRRLGEVPRETFLGDPDKIGNPGWGSDIGEPARAAVRTRSGGR